MGKGDMEKGGKNFVWRHSGSVLDFLSINLRFNKYEHLQMKKKKRSQHILVIASLIRGL